MEVKFFMRVLLEFLRKYLNSTDSLRKRYEEKSLTTMLIVVRTTNLLFRRFGGPSGAPACKVLVNQLEVARD